MVTRVSPVVLLGASDVLKVWHVEHGEALAQARDGFAALGDVVFVELPEVGDTLAAADEAGVVESVKAASDVYAPVAGEVIATNALLEDAPETVNSDPYNDGWFYKLQPSDTTELNSLLSADEYAAHCAEED